MIDHRHVALTLNRLSAMMMDKDGSTLLCAFPYWRSTLEDALSLIEGQHGIRRVLHKSGAIYYEVGRLEGTDISVLYNTESSTWTTNVGATPGDYEFASNNLIEQYEKEQANAKYWREGVFRIIHKLLEIMGQQVDLIEPGEAIEATIKTLDAMHEEHNRIKLAYNETLTSENKLKRANVILSHKLDNLTKEIAEGLHVDNPRE